MVPPSNGIQYYRQHHPNSPNWLQLLKHRRFHPRQVLPLRRRKPPTTALSTSSAHRPVTKVEVPVLLPHIPVRTRQRNNRHDLSPNRHARRPTLTRTSSRPTSSTWRRHTARPRLQPHRFQTTCASNLLPSPRRPHPRRPRAVNPSTRTNLRRWPTHLPRLRRMPTERAELARVATRTPTAVSKSSASTACRTTAPLLKSPTR